MNPIFITGSLFLVLLIFVVIIYIRVNRERARRENEIVEIKGVQGDTISHTTHQLRSPITAVKGYTSLILDEQYGKVSKELKYPLDVIMRSSEHLAVIVEEYREFGQLERGNIELNYKETMLRDLVKDTAEELTPEAESNGHCIDVEIKKDVPVISLDESRIKQVLHNIIENSIAYTPEGTDVHITVSFESNKALITVSDTGPGIPDEELELIFDKYKRGKLGLASGKGTGLGLYIARAIVRSHGGDIFATRSKRYGGASFQIEIPVT